MIWSSNWVAFFVAQKRPSSSNIVNLAAAVTKISFGSLFSLNNYSKLLDYQAINAYEAGNIASANAMASRANSIREFGQVGDIFEITDDAQKGGSFASIFVPLGTLVKAPAAAAKGMLLGKIPVNSVSRDSTRGRWHHQN